MPTYSYRCTECGHAFDIVQAFTDDTLSECPSCAGRLRKVFSPIGVTFSGSGFYRTDSRAEATSAASKSSGGSSSTSSSSGGSGSSGASTSSGSSDASSAGGSSAAATPAASST